MLSVGPAFLLLVCLSSFTASAQEPAEPFRFGKFDLELLDQVKQLDKKFEDQGLVFNDAEMNAYLNRIGQKLIKNEEQLENVDWRFRILREPSVNAFALPNGSVYVHTGLLARMENESQLAAILAHEIIHVRNRHSYRSYRSYRKKTLTVNLIAAAAGLAGAGGLGMAAQFILAISVTGYSRELEKEADLAGAELMFESPYDARAMVEALECLEHPYELDLDGEPFYADHPRTKARVNYVREFLSGHDQASRAGANLDQTGELTDKAKYQSDVAGLTRHDLQLAIDDGLYRTAVTLGKRLLEVQSDAANYTALADAYAALGPRSFEPTTEELSKKGKGEARKRRNKLTLLEEERTLASTPSGQELQKANFSESEKLYRRALELNPDFAPAWRGLGQLFEKSEQPQSSIEAYRQYIELQPGAMDRLLIMRRIKNLEGKLAPGAEKAENKQPEKK